MPSLRVPIKPISSAGWDAWPNGNKKLPKNKGFYFVSK